MKIFLVPAILIHTITIVMAFIASFLVFFNNKGTKFHKIMGWVFASNMLISSISSFWITTSGHFSFIHILSILTIFWVCKAIYAVRLKPKNWLYIHLSNMANAYLGILIAGIGVIIRHIIMPDDKKAWIIASLIMAAISIPIMVKLTLKYKKES